MKRILLILAAIACLAAPVQARKHTSGDIVKKNVVLRPQYGKFHVGMDLVLDGLNLRSNQQIFVTPLLESKDGRQTVQLPAVAIEGRNMSIIAQRDGSDGIAQRKVYPDAQRVRRYNGKSQSVHYAHDVAYEPWMRRAALRVVVDTCGCGNLVDPYNRTSEVFPVQYDPIEGMRCALATPVDTAEKIIAHNGRARVQFEVDRIELHEQPYRCKSGQLIDNREQLSVIDDSIRYALSDPNVEISSIHICGFASPESPYDHNNYLATNRSKALAEYISRRYQLPVERCTYSAVVENWDEFREQVVASSEISERERADLLELIDRTCYGPADYDQKEQELKTDPKFADLYRRLILPHWFPQLRCSQFTINTHLKPMTIEQLQQVLIDSPSLLSLNQIYAVANSYQAGSTEYAHAMEVALKYYPESPVANINAAVAAIAKRDFKAAANYVAKADDSPEAENVRGILAAEREDFDTAREHFSNAATALPEAARNLQLLGDE